MRTPDSGSMHAPVSKLQSASKKTTRNRDHKKHQFMKAPPGTHSACPEGWPKTGPFFVIIFRPL